MPRRRAPRSQKIEPFALPAGFATRGPLPGWKDESDPVQERIPQEWHRPRMICCVGVAKLLPNDAHNSDADYLTDYALRLGLKVYQAAWDGRTEPTPRVAHRVRWARRTNYVRREDVLNAIEANPGISADELLILVFNGNSTEWAEPDEEKKARAKLAFYTNVLSHATNHQHIVIQFDSTNRAHYFPAFVLKGRSELLRALDKNAPHMRPALDPVRAAEEVKFRDRVAAARVIERWARSHGVTGELQSSLVPLITDVLRAAFAQPDPIEYTAADEEEENTVEEVATDAR